MSKFIKLVKSDFNRVILTDVLPYELPFIFTNEGFYNSLKDRTVKESPFLSDLLLNYTDKKPFEYYIKKDKNSDRKLYLIHPSSQINLSDVYKKYASLITHLCSRSSYSLRAANSIASLYYEKNKVKSHEKYKDEGVEGDIEDTQPKYASSFFKYKKYDFLYKFYDSYEFHKIEKKFHYLFKLDISKCFDSISTSMLINSLRTENLAKEAKNHSNFESAFSSALEKANYGRTHGIVIGPEFARIYAEIILQSIDISIKSQLLSDKIEEGNDYIIKRYVDDFFIFYNNENTKSHILSVIKDKLAEYKLYCNESKFIQYSVPIITPVTSAKIKIQERLATLFEIFEKDPLHNKDNDESSPHHNISIINSLNRHDLLANRIIRDIKCLIKDSDVDFNSITGYFFTLIKIKSSALDRDYPMLDDELQEERLCRFILIILELSFFIFAMDLRVRSTYLISQIIIILHRLSDRLRNEKKERVLKKISDEANSILTFFIKNRPVYNLEILNLVITLGVFFDNSKISKDKLQDILDLNTPSPHYFELMVGLFYIKKNRDYRSVKSKIVRHIKNCLSTENSLIYSEYTHIFFDSISCPYISFKDKTEIISIALESNNLTKYEPSYIHELISCRAWFVDWNNQSSIIEKLLMKKELRTPYGN